MPSSRSPASCAKCLPTCSFALYLKTKNFRWHMSGPHFRDYHLLLEEQGSQIFAMTDDIAERARKIGGTTIKSISDVSKHQRLKDDNDEGVAPENMLADLRADNLELTRNLRSTHELCEKHNDVATVALLLCADGARRVSRYRG
jgi:starvation-inducible DNA-binding protein